jgi:GH24 family phage-related lysozyme (muramidase)
MYPSVLSSFVSFTQKFEGFLDFMYLDVKGLVTIGYGNLIDPIDEALALTFEAKANPGTPVSADAVRAEWNVVKSRTDLKLRGGVIYGTITKLQITRPSLDALMQRKLGAFESILTQRFPTFGTWPADAQLGAMSMSWAMGPAFTGTWPKFTEACLAGDWNGAADNCKMNDVGNPGLKPRNAANDTLFRNAAQAVSQSLALDTLYYPKDLSS